MQICYPVYAVLTQEGETESAIDAKIRISHSTKSLLQHFAGGTRKDMPPHMAVTHMDYIQTVAHLAGTSRQLQHPQALPYGMQHAQAVGQLIVAHILKGFGQAQER